MRSLSTTIKLAIPGVLLSFFVASSSFLLSNIIPLIGAPTIAILVGIILGNTIFKSEKWSRGTVFCEKTLLEFSVVFIGFSVTLSAFGAFGVRGVLYIILQMAFTIIVVIFLGKRFGFTEKSSMLMAGGNAVCGSSAIASIAPAIGASDKEKGAIITLVNLIGTVLMLLTPLISAFVYLNNPLKQGAFIGGIVQSVGQVLGGASILGEAVAEKAMLFKILRIMFLVFIVIIFSQINRIKNETNDNSKKNSHTISIKEIKKAIPWYIIGFVVCCLINSTLTLPALVVTTAQSISKWFEIIALAAIGLRLDLSTFSKNGKAYIKYGSCVGIVQILLSIILIFILL